ncbi:hypothetical protein T484DRAFT_1943663 [Baffinella frigidus]|nr:hypothetical protein T484DRAFT_1943663 [Cryptophyta sp. CCMP2293]
MCLSTLQVQHSAPVAGRCQHRTRCGHPVPVSPPIRPKLLTRGSHPHATEPAARASLSYAHC